ncbi:MAG: porin [Corynebacterium sp.]|nr:porin [Corynebacterium sp.]
MVEFFTNWNTLSSDGLVGTLLGFIGDAAKWSGAAADLLGLVI